MKRNLVATVLVGVLSFVQVVGAADPPHSENSQNGDTDKGNISAKGVNFKTAQELENFEFGIAIGLESYNQPYIREAKTFGETRTVRVTDKQRINASLWAETHYTWDGLAAKKLGRTHSAPGFYLGVRLLGEDSKIFDAFSIGFMWSFKRTRLDDRSGSAQSFKSINIGVGPVWHRTREFTSGIKDGKDLPAQYKDIEYKKEDEISWMLMVSTGFF